MKKVHVGRLAGTALAVFAINFGYDHFMHGWLLHESFYKFQTFWRPMEEMGETKFMAAFMGSALLFAVMFAWIFHCGWQGTRMEGLRYGFYMWLLVAVTQHMLWYALLPVGQLAAWWIVLDLPRCLLLGLAAGWIYKPREAV
jgi:hypothetical protein